MAENTEVNQTPTPVAEPTAFPAPLAAADAGLLAVRLAHADPDGGALPATAREAALEAIRLAAALHRSDDEARARAWLCTHLLRLGEHAELLAQAPAALALLTAPAVARERRELLRVVALSGSETGAHDAALDAAQELVRLTAGLDDAGAALTAAYGLAICFERMGDSWQATRLLTQALDDHGSGAPESVRMLATNALCAVSIGLIYSLRGTAAAPESDSEVQAALTRARQAGEAARTLLTGMTDPVYEVVVLGNLGEVLLHQGEIEAAEPLLAQAHALAVQRGLRAYAWRVQVSRAIGLLARRRPQAALDSMLALIEAAGAAMPQQTAIRAHDVAYRACKALGLFERALAHFEIVERTERRRATSQLRAQSQLFVTRTESQQAQWQAEQARLEAQRQRARAAEFAESAERDPLTGLGNRRHLARRCAELLPAAERDTRPLALALLDIDHFKHINDRHGHATGDRVLVRMAQLLRDNTRSRDVVVRHGGEEFVLVMPGMSLEQATEVCERLRDRVARHDWHEALVQGLDVTISIGLTAAPGYEAQALLQRADDALYRAKRGGRNRIELSVS